MRARHALLVLLAACGDAQSPGARHGAGPACGSEERVVLDCAAEIDHREALEIPADPVEAKAIERVNAQIASGAAQHDRTCSAYNACEIELEAYRAETEAIRARHAALPEMIEALKGDRSAALDALYQAFVPEAERSEEITFHLGVSAELPPEAGGGERTLAAGEVVPSGSKVAFSVATSRPAHVYMFHASPAGEVTVLFPEPRVGTDNPLAPGKQPRIPPPGQSFRLDDADVGVEAVYLIVSHEPIEEVATALERYKSGKARKLRDEALVLGLSELGEGADCGLALTASTADCRRARGVPLGGARAGAPVGVDSMSVRTLAGDGVIVQRFSFRHVKLADYAKSGGTRGGPIME